MNIQEDIDHLCNLRWTNIKRMLSNLILESYPELSENSVDSHVEASMTMLKYGLLKDNYLLSSGMLPNDFKFVYFVTEQDGFIKNLPKPDDYSIITKLEFD